MSVWAVVGIFFFSFLQLLGPSLSLSFRLISKKEAPLFLSRAFDTSKKSNIFRREREQFFFFDEETTRDTTPLTLSFSLSVPPLWRSYHHIIDIDDRSGGWPTQCEDLSRFSSDDDHHRRDRQRRERIRERGKKKNIRKRRETWRRGPKTRESDTFSSLSWNFSKRTNENVPRA